jgi:ribosome-interacting GTPase 1
MSYDLFDKYGIDNCDIILLELVEANSKDELYTTEAHYIKTINCVNKYIPIRTKEELKEIRKFYDNDNKDIKIKLPFLHSKLTFKI